MYVKCGSTMPEKFHVTNGFSQGGVLSPFLCDVYVDDISKQAILSLYY